MPTLAPMEATLTTADGLKLRLREWPCAQARGTVLMVHGLGEHIGRYEPVAAQLLRSGRSVVGYDQRGHGESEGARGALNHPDDLLTDLAQVIDAVRLQHPGPLTLLGHSMGGLVAGLFAARNLRPVDALVMSSPSLDPGLSGFQRFLLAVLPRFAPDLRVSNALDVSKLSHDPDVVSAYKSDKLVHDRVSARLAKFIADGGAETLAAAPAWKTPTLLMFAGQDKLVAPAGSRAFAAAAPKEVVTAQCFEPLYHEIFNELDAEPVFAALKQWLDARY